MIEHQSCGLLLQEVALLGKFSSRYHFLILYDTEYVHSRQVVFTNISLFLFVAYSFVVLLVTYWENLEFHILPFHLIS